MPYKNPKTKEQKKKQIEANKKWQASVDKDKLREMRREWQKKWREKNRDKVNAYFREYYKQNSKKQIARATLWNKNNTDKIKKYRDNDSRKEYLKKWKLANPEKIQRYKEKNKNKKRRFREKNPLPLKVKEIKTQKDIEEENFRNKTRSASQKIKLLNKCEICGTKNMLERHHNKGYDNPNIFLTLCKKCHTKIHRKLKEAQERHEKHQPSSL